MRDILRLIVLAVLLFGVSALAVLLGDPGIAASVHEHLRLADQSVDYASIRTSAPNEGQSDRNRVIQDQQSGKSPGVDGDPENPNGLARLNEGEAAARIARLPSPGLGLEGFPSTTTLRFTFPPQLNIVEGQLQLDLHTQLMDPEDGLLRVLINGTEREAIVIERGEHTLPLTYDLLPADLSAGEALVTLDADGTSRDQICPTDVTNLGAAISVLGTSGIVLSLEAPLSIREDRTLLASPWPLASTNAPAFIWATQWLGEPRLAAQPDPARPPRTVQLADPGETADAATEVGQVPLNGVEGWATAARNRRAAMRHTHTAQSRLPVFALASDLQPHTSRRSSPWSLDDKLADLLDGVPPSSPHPAPQSGQRPDALEWSVRILLNGTIVYSANHPDASEEIRLDIPVPSDARHLLNQLATILMENSAGEGICRPDREAGAKPPGEAGQEGRDTAGLAERVVAAL